MPVRLGCTPLYQVRMGTKAFVGGYSPLYKACRKMLFVLGVAAFVLGTACSSDNHGVVVPPPGYVYADGTLTHGLSLGVATSSSPPPANMVKNDTLDIQCAYPPNQLFGTVFITVGQPVPLGQPRNTLDYSAFTSLVLELKGAQGGEHVWVGVKTETDPDNGQEPKVLVSHLTASWQTVKIPLSQLVNPPNYPANRFTHIYIPCELVFDANDPETIYFRTIRYE